jgi:hypothetical protein
MRDGGGGERSGIDKISQGRWISVEMFDDDISGSLAGFCKIVLLRQGILFFGHGLSLQPGSLGGEIKR